MLWRKTWYETRTQFLLAVAVTATICALIVVFEDGPRRNASPAMSYTTYIWNAIYKDYLRNLFALLVVVLGGGTLLQERSRGTSGFTLALPVSRVRIVGARAAVGVAEVFCLAAVPAAVLPLVSRLIGERYAMADALGFAVLWWAGGTLLLSAALLMSSVIANEYVAWSATFLAIMAYEGLVNFTSLSRYPAIDPFRLMNGSGVHGFDASRHVMAGALPGPTIVGTLAVAAFVLLVATVITTRTDY